MPAILEPSASGLAALTAALPQVLTDLPGLPSVDAIEQQLVAVEREMDGLRGELDMLRQRDRTLNQYMQRLDEELRMAARLQQEFLPRSLPEVGPVRFHTLWRPCGYVSGDFYDVLRLDEEHVGFYVADAVGHGMPAALLTMFMKNALVTKEVGRDSYRLLDPGESLRRLNDALVEQQLSGGTFCTACYGVLNTRTLELRFANAGHPAPLLLRGDGPATAVRAEGPLLGIFERESYATTTWQLQPGDKLVAFTDGMEVAFAADNAMDVTQWRDEVTRRGGMGGAEMLADLTRALDGESGSLNPRDDLTMVVVEIA